MEENLVEIFSLSRRAPGELFLMTYPSADRFYGIANEIIRTTARAHGMSLIDLEADFRQRCEGQDPCRELLFEDQHPTREGYALIAHRVAEAIGHRLDR